MEARSRLVVTALQRAGLTIEVSDLVDAHGTGAGARLFTRYAHGRAKVGFTEARAHGIVEIQWRLCTSGNFGELIRSGNGSNDSIGVNII